VIKIDRDKFPPDDKFKIAPNKGRQKWRVKENQIITEYKANNVPFLQGNFTFPKHPSYELWKNELINCQGKKCCYCEKPIDKGAIEHYRPKNAWKQSKGSQLNRPGYYWLAYRWLNLLLSCNECNSSGNKGNLFPISGSRANTLKCDLRLENESLINPYDEDPATYISFYKSDIISLHPKGKVTIEILSLDTRNDLAPIRDDRFQLYKKLLQISKLPLNNGVIDNDEIEEAKIQTKKFKKKKQFSGMLLSNISQGII